MPLGGRASFWHGCVVIFADLMPTMLLSPVMPGVMVGFFNGGNDCTGSDSKSPACHDATSKASLLTGVVDVAVALLTFFGSPVIGAVSDSFGRRPVFILSQTLTLVPPCMLVLYDWSGEATLFFWLYYLFRVINGYVDSTSIATAYIADVQVPATRTRSFGNMAAVMGIALVLGPLIGGFLGRKAAFYGCVACALFALFYVRFVLPESLDAQFRRPFSCRTVNPFASLKILLRSTLFFRLGATIGFNSFCVFGSFGILALYIKDQFGVNSVFLAIWMAEFGFLMLFVQTVVLRALIARVTDRTIMLLGVLFPVLALPLFGVMWESWNVFVLTVPLGLGMLTFPAVGAIKSYCVDESEQGTIQGALYGVRALGQGFGPLFFNLMFTLWTSNNYGFPYVRGMTFFIGGFLGLISFFVANSVPKDIKPVLTMRDKLLNFAPGQTAQRVASSLADQAALLGDAGDLDDSVSIASLESSSAAAASHAAGGTAVAGHAGAAQGPPGSVSVPVPSDALTEALLARHTSDSSTASSEFGGFPSPAHAAHHAHQRASPSSGSHSAQAARAGGYDDDQPDDAASLARNLHY